MTGIYKIISKIDDRCYIGSSINIHNRWKEHTYDLKNNKHRNSKLQNFVNKHSLNNIQFIVIEECLQEELLIREQFYLDTTENLFNISTNSSSPMLGRKHKQESLDIMSRNNKGKGNAMFGTKRPEHVIEALVNYHRNNKQTKIQKLKRIINDPRRKEIIIEINNSFQHCISLRHAAKIAGVKTSSIVQGTKMINKIKKYSRCDYKLHLVKENIITYDKINCIENFIDLFDDDLLPIKDLKNEIK